MSLPTLPGAKAVAGWLARFPTATAIAAGRLPITWVDLPHRVRELAPPDPLLAATLRAAAHLAARTPPEAPTPAALDRLLRVGEARVAAALHDAEFSPGSSIAASDEKAPAFGPRHLEPPAFRTAIRRTRLAFRDGAFLPLPDPGALGPGLESPAGSAPVLDWVRDAANRPREWKQAAGFPPDLGPGDLLPPGADGRFTGATVPLVQFDEVTAVVLRTPDRAIAFATAGPDWILPGDPTFTVVDARTSEAFPELDADPTPGEAAAAWEAWAKSRSVPGDDLPACRSTASGLRLAVEAPPRLATWLKTHRADLFRGDTWLWIGNGPLRRAATLHVVG